MAMENWGYAASLFRRTSSSGFRGAVTARLGCGGFRNGEQVERCNQMAIQLAKRSIKPLLLLLAILLVLDVIAIVLCPMVHWVGRTDVDISFIVTNAETGQPIPGASIQVLQGDSSFCKTDQNPPFVLTADENGRATVRAMRCMCFGTSGWNGWRYRNTFGTHMPEWEFQIVKPGYVKTEAFWLSSFLGSVKRGKEVWNMDVPVQLTRS
jgi:hypothetical protein